MCIKFFYEYWTNSFEYLSILTYRNHYTTAWSPDWNAKYIFKRKIWNNRFKLRNPIHIPIKEFKNKTFIMRFYGIVYILCAYLLLVHFTCLNSHKMKYKWYFQFEILRNLFFNNIKFLLRITFAAIVILLVINIYINNVNTT